MPSRASPPARHASRYLFALLRRVGRTIENPRTLSTVRRFFLAVALVSAFFLVSGIFGQRLGNFTVALGLLGAGVAVAAQEVVLSVAGWLAILFADFYRTGDRVQLGGIRGDVIQITLFRTMLMEIGEWVKADLYTGRTVRVANCFVFKEAVVNYTSEFPFIWDEFTVPIRYDSDREAARDMLARVIESGRWRRHRARRNPGRDSLLSTRSRTRGSIRW